jgi:hypothetical protein
MSRDSGELVHASPGLAEPLRSRKLGIPDYWRQWAKGALSILHPVWSTSGQRHWVGSGAVMLDDSPPPARLRQSPHRIPEWQGFRSRLGDR